MAESWGEVKVRGHGITLTLLSAMVPESKCVHCVWQAIEYRWQVMWSVPLASNVVSKCADQSRLVMRGRGPRLMARSTIDLHSLTQGLVSNHQQCFLLFAFRLELTWGLIENQTLIDDRIPLLLRQGIRAGCTS